MLGDMGGVFGFFLGVTMLNCLQNTWDYLKRWQHSILRLVLTFDQLFKIYWSKTREKRLKRTAKFMFTNSDKPPRYSKLIPCISDVSFYILCVIWFSRIIWNRKSDGDQVIHLTIANQTVHLVIIQVIVLLCKIWTVLISFWMYYFRSGQEDNVYWKK